MLKSLLKNTLLIITLSSFTLYSQDTTDVIWDAALQPGQLEAAITAGGSGVYKLEAGKKYLTSENIPVEAGQAIHIVGAATTNGSKPATIQPLANAEGVLGHKDGQFFNLVGAGAELALKNLVLNAYAAGEEGSVGIAAARSSMNKIVVDNCIISHVNYLAFHTMGTQTDFHITNSVMKAFTNGPGGMFYGGAVWGAGSWMGTIDTLVFQNNTLDGVLGEGLVIYEHVDYGLVDHNTFTNIAMDIIWYRGQNNLQVTNNLLYNTKSYGSSTYDVSGWGVWWKGGAGQMALRKQGIYGTPSGLDITPAVVTLDTNMTNCSVTTTVVTPADTVVLTAGTYVMGDGQVVNMNDRNINWSNNAAVWSPALTTFMDNMAATPWSWDVTTVVAAVLDITPAVLDTTYDDDCHMVVTVTTAADTVVTTPATTVEGTQGDTMMTAAMQLVWADDSTLSTIALDNGVTSTDNAVLAYSDVLMNLDESYIDFQLARTLDFRDDQTTQGVGATNNWSYENDGNMNEVQWPMHYRASYNYNSVAATHCTHGGPVGSTRWMTHGATDGLASDHSVALPEAFSLNQNYPNPFNPSTEIAFSLEQASTITLTIFNVLGQKVKVLADGSKQAGTHTLSWDGRDQMGAAVSTGLYFYTLTDGNKSVTKKMALMK